MRRTNTFFEFWISGSNCSNYRGVQTIGSVTISDNDISLLLGLWSWWRSDAGLIMLYKTNDLQVVIHGKASASLSRMSHHAIFLPWVFSAVSGNLSGTVFVRLECRQRTWIEDIHLKSGINYFKANYWSLQEVHSLKLQSWEITPTSKG